MEAGYSTCALWVVGDNGGVARVGAGGDDIPQWRDVESSGELCVVADVTESEACHLCRAAYTGFELL